MSRSDNSSKYNKLHTIVVSVRLNKKTDADIIKILDSVRSKQGYIKRLVREDIGRKSEIMPYCDNCKHRDLTKTLNGEQYFYCKRNHKYGGWSAVCSEHEWIYLKGDT